MKIHDHGLIFSFMKKIIPLLCLFVSISSSCLLAHSNIPSTPSTTLQANHVGSSNSYRIGSEKAPVTAMEYSIYLHEKGFHEIFTGSSKYYDATFMKDKSWWNNYFHPSLNPSIMCTGDSYMVDTQGGCMFYLSTYDYYVIDGHENDIIDAVATSSIQKEFTAWRKQRAFLAQYSNLAE